jgi:hypothetical protein
VYSETTPVHTSKSVLWALIQKHSVSYQRKFKDASEPFQELYSKECPLVLLFII